MLRCQNTVKIGPTGAANTAVSKLYKVLTNHFARLANLYLEVNNNKGVCTCNVSNNLKVAVNLSCPLTSLSRFSLYLRCATHTLLSCACTLALCAFHSEDNTAETQLLQQETHQAATAFITPKYFIQLQGVLGLKSFIPRQTPEIGSEMFTDFSQTLAT